MTLLSYTDALPKDLRENFEKAGIIISDIKIDPAKDAIPIEKIADRANLIPSYIANEYGDSTIYLTFAMSNENKRFAIAKAIANRITNRKEAITKLLDEVENNKEFENELDKYQELIERKANWADNADARRLLLPDDIFLIAVEHTKQKAINKRQLIYKLAEQFQVTPCLVEQQLTILTK